MVMPLQTGQHINGLPNIVLVEFSGIKYVDVKHAKEKSPELSELLGAQDWNRTSTILRTADFESAASTNSATWAFGYWLTVNLLM